MGEVDENLGTALRALARPAAPADVGLPVGRARRAAGLRREELAELAGVSVDYVVRLEQGRATTPSAQVVASLARALQLHPPERDHVTAWPACCRRRRDISTHIPPGCTACSPGSATSPVAVFSADWTLLSWTPAWAALLGDPSDGTPAQRNLARAVFTPDPTASRPGRCSTTATPWPGPGRRPARALVDHPRRPRTGRPGRGPTRGNSTEFAGLWDEGAVGLHPSARKTVVHPESAT